MLAEGTRSQPRRGVCADSAESRGQSLTREARPTAADGAPSSRLPLPPGAQRRRVPSLPIPVPPDRPPPSAPFILPPLIPLHRLILPSSSAPLRPHPTAFGRPRSTFPLTSLHAALATTRPTCRRGHFSMGPRFQLFKKEMSFRFSSSRVPALLSFPWPMGCPVHLAPPLATKFLALIGRDASTCVSGNVVWLPRLPRGPGRAEIQAGNSYWLIRAEVESRELASLWPSSAQCLPGEVVFWRRRTVILRGWGRESSSSANFPILGLSPGPRHIFLPFSSSVNFLPVTVFRYEIKLCVRAVKPEKFGNGQEGCCPKMQRKSDVPP